MTYAIVAAGEISGAVRIRRIAESTSFEFGIWLGRSARGLGIGTVALAQTIRKARAAGCRELRAQTTTGNVPALGLLRSHGFRLTPPSEGTVEAVLAIDAAPDETP
jgi:RimJ/RimL family protein N-acetyltransferase